MIDKSPDRDSFELLTPELVPPALEVADHLLDRWPALAVLVGAVGP